MESKNLHPEADSSLIANHTKTSSEGRISFLDFLSDIPHAVFHVDRGIFFNFMELFRRPGAGIHDYLAGDRKSFFHPASYLVIALLFNYLIVKITNLHFFDEHELQFMTPAAAQAIKDYDALQWWFLEHTYLYILIAIPASTLFLLMIFQMARKKLNFAETAVVVLFTIGQGVLIQSFIYLFFGWVEDGSFRRGMEMVNMTILISYASYVAYQLLSTIRFKIVRSMISLFAGAGLAVVWIASAYLLYYFMS